MGTCLLLGGNGFIGTSLCGRLLDEDRVLVYSNTSALPEELTDRVELIQGDFRAESDFDCLLDGVDTVYHLISTTIPSDSTEGIVQEIEENILPTIRLLEAIARRSDILFVYFSSGGVVYGNCPLSPTPESAMLHPISPYGVQKAMIEMYTELYHHLQGIEYKIIRLSNPYGISQDPDKRQGVIPIFVRKIRNGEEITVWGDGQNIRDYIYIEDAIDGVEAALRDKSGAHIYNIGSGIGYSLNQVIDLICRESMVERPSITYLPPRVCDVEVNILDTTRIHSATGWSPKVSLEQGIRELVRLQNLGERTC